MMPADQDQPLFPSDSKTDFCADQEILRYAYASQDQTQKKLSPNDRLSVWHECLHLKLVVRDRHEDGLPLQIFCN